jgi:hypothetical protein
VSTAIKRVLSAGRFCLAETWDRLGSKKLAEKQPRDIDSQVTLRLLHQLENLPTRPELRIKRP